MFMDGSDFDEGADSSARGSTAGYSRHGGSGGGDVRTASLAQQAQLEEAKARARMAGNGMGVSSATAGTGFGQVTHAAPQFSTPAGGGGFDPSTFGQTGGDAAGFGGDTFGAGSALPSTGLAQAFAEDDAHGTVARSGAGEGAGGGTGAVPGDVLGDDDELEDVDAGGHGGEFASLDAGARALPAARGRGIDVPVAVDTHHSPVRFVHPGRDDGAPAAAAAASAAADDYSRAHATPPRSHADASDRHSRGDSSYGDEGSHDSEDDDGRGAVAASPEAAVSRAEHFGRGGSADMAAMGTAPLAPFMDNMREFIRRPLPLSVGCVACYIERTRGGMFSGNPVFSLYTKEGDRFVLAGKKRAGKRTSNYIISAEKRDLSREGAGFAGKLRGNFVGTEYIVYDDGEAPGARKAGGQVRKELALVEYQSNVMTSRGPRKMKVAVPRVDRTDGSHVVYQPSEGEDTMADIFKAGHTQDMVIMVNKPPKWNEGVKAFVLNFNGRVTMASVKNFQLVTPDDYERVVLQFGRVGKDLFTMDVQWPLSPLQAFAICLSSFDYKLACE